MKYRDIILSANGNLRKSKLRTFLTSSAVFMGALTLMLTSGVGFGLKSYVQEQVNAAGAKDALIISAKTEGGGGPVSNDEATEYNPNDKSTNFGFAEMTMLNDKDIQAIAKTDNIESVDPLYTTAVEYIGNGNKKYKATVTQAVEGLNIPLTSGRPVEAHSPNYEITLTPALVEPLGFANVEAAVGKKVEMGFKSAAGKIVTIPVTIVGVQAKTFIQGNAMNMSISLARAAFLKTTEGLPDYQRYQYTMAIAKFDDSISGEQLQTLKQELDKKGFSASTLEDQLGIINAVINGITTFLNVFAAIALAAASFGIVNTLFMAVQERTREIGLMKALGMGRKKIFLLFSLEAVLIGFWSSIVALGAANILGRIGSNVASSTILKDFEGLELFSFPALPMLAVMGIVTGIAFLASTLPARRASRLDPIEALRYE